MTIKEKSILNQTVDIFCTEGNISKTLKKFPGVVGIRNRIADKFQRRQCRQMIEELNLPFYRRILDVNYGNGYFTSLLYQHNLKLSSYNKHFDIRSINLPDAKNIHYSDGYFDLVISRCGLHDIENPEEIVREMVRVGGDVVVIEANRENYWLEKFRYHHFTLEELKEIVKPDKIRFLDIFYPPSFYMGFFAFSPYIPKSKKAFIVLYRYKKKRGDITST